ncbi:MAG TPA: response regulator [Terriglobia bacterium]|nr:response regulator [Terriglobia bacterium]
MTVDSNPRAQDAAAIAPVVLIAGAPGALPADLSQRLNGVSVRTASSGDAALSELKTGDVSLLVLDHSISAPPAIEVLCQIRATAELASLRVFYCLSQGPELLRKLVQDLGVDEILFQPVDPEELARQASGVLGLSVLPLSTTESEEEFHSAVADIWERSRAAKIESLEILDDAGAALLEGTLTGAARQAAEREAHKLAGSLGTFGFAAASRFAREMETTLRSGTRVSESQALRFSELAVALRLELERTPNPNPVPTAQEQPDSRQAALLIVAADQDLATKLAEEGVSRGLRIETAFDLAAAQSFLACERPEIVLLALDGSPWAEEALNLLDELAGAQPPVPAMVVTGSNSLTDRVEVARRGGRGFVSKTLAPSEILDAVVSFLDRQRPDRTRVLAVDDSTEVLNVLKAMLEPHGILLTTLQDPLGFWDAIETCSPEMVILDVDMPHLSGIELCRVLRSDPRRAGLPVVFLTGFSDAETVSRVFAAGADDFVSKPIVGPELVTRILNRLERARLFRTFAETDSMTGVASRRKFSRALDDFLRLAHRHGELLALAVLELEGLSALNARHGHAVGDEALRHLGRLLGRAFHSEDAVGRWGGSEFVIGMYGMSRYDGVQRLGDLLADLRARPLKIPEETEARLSFGAGVAEYPCDGGDLRSLYAAAALACRQAAAGGGGRVLPAGWNPQARDALRSVDVLLATGDEAEALLLLHALEAQGCRVRWLRDGQSVLRLLGGAEPDLRAKVIFLDVDLPGLDGLSLLKHLAADGLLGETRVVMLTAPAMGDDAPAALALGAVDHVAKPFSLPAAIRRIRRALEMDGAAAGSRQPPERRNDLPSRNVP